MSFPGFGGGSGGKPGGGLLDDDPWRRMMMMQTANNMGGYLMSAAQGQPFQPQQMNPMMMMQMQQQMQEAQRKKAETEQIAGMFAERPPMPTNMLPPGMQGPGQQVPFGGPLAQPPRMGGLLSEDQATAGRGLPPDMQKSYLQSILGQKPQERKTATDVGGLRRYLDTGERTFPGAEKEKSSGPFAGKALDAQDSNILLQGDPSSAKYGLAYYRQFQVPKMVMTENGMVPMIIPAPPGIRPPARDAPASQGIGPGPVAGSPVPGTAKRPTDTQQKAASYGVRLQSSNEIISQYEDLGAELAGYISGSDYFPNVAKSTERQQLEQAQRDFINAQLRRESGAVIADTEFDNAAKQYFPQPGDDPEVIAQKRRAREIAIQNMGQEAGRAQRAAPPSPPRAEPGPQAAGPPVGTIDGGYRFKGGDPADKDNWEKVR